MANSFFFCNPAKLHFSQPLLWLSLSSPTATNASRVPWGTALHLWPVIISDTKTTVEFAFYKLMIGYFIPVRDMDEMGKLVGPKMTDSPFLLTTERITRSLCKYFVARNLCPQPRVICLCLYGISIMFIA